MSHCAAPLDGYGPAWADGVAALVQRAALAWAHSGVTGCFTVLDLQPWRQLDAWWLRRSLEPLARHGGLAVRYVPCTGPATPPCTSGASSVAPAWSSGLCGDAPVHLAWPRVGGLPVCAATGEPWQPDGPVLVLAGDLAQRLPQHLLLAHHGTLQEWRAEFDKTRKWELLLPGLLSGGLAGWVTDSARAYTSGLTSAMLSLPLAYWQFISDLFAWAVHGAAVLTRAEGWSSLAQMREAPSPVVQVREDAPPVNFHWLSQEAPRLGATAHLISARRTDAVQLMVKGLPQEGSLLPLLCAPLAMTLSTSRAERARVAGRLAASGDLQGAVAVLDLEPEDPLVLRTAWAALAHAARNATDDCAILRVHLGAWLDRLMTNNPWLGEDATLLRGAGHIALACWQPHTAQVALRALAASGQACPADDVALACSLEMLGQLDPALAAGRRSVMRRPDDAEAGKVLRRIEARISSLGGPWGVQHEKAGSSLMLDPLHEAHAAALAHQLRDPAICIMTVLAPIAADDDGRQWIRERRAEGPAAYAVMHRQLGFVGYASISLWETTGFISYWIGTDYQGRGFAADLIEAVCDLAWRNGLELLVSSAYEDNTRSLRALRRGGFVPMDLRALPPDGDRSFVMLPAPALASMTHAEARRRLVTFCDMKRSGLRFDSDAACLHEADALIETTRSYP